MSQLSLGKQFKSFSSTFWIGNFMEMLERLAYYGVRVVLPIYMVLAIEEGGPQFDHIQKGSIYAWWALVQSGLPVVTGGYADRYGYKLTVGIAIAVKIIGYLIMGFALPIASMLSNGASDGVAGHAYTYGVFMAGCLFLATGTALFKPGLQGILALQMNEKNDSLGWSVFYQLVNVGGFLGPYLAGVMRLMDWQYVFISCAVIVSLNYLLLLTFSEPAKVIQKGPKKVGSFLSVLVQSVIDIYEPRLMAFLVVFSGFWMMFHQLFDLLPNFIDQWVDSSMVLAAVAPLITGVGLSIPAEWAGNLPQEQMININAGMIMIMAFIVGWATGKVRAMTVMIAGILVSSIAIAGLGTRDGWLVVGMIALFSFGEMLASPTKMRYFSAIAPPEKKGLYLGYINATGGIGWYIGSKIAGKEYEENGDIVVLARRHLVSLGQDSSAIMEMKKTEVLPLLADKLGTNLEGVKELLWTTYEPFTIWSYFAMIGIISMFGLIGYDRIQKYQGAPWEPWALIVLTAVVTMATYGWMYVLIFCIPMVLWQVFNGKKTSVKTV